MSDAHVELRAEFKKRNNATALRLMVSSEPYRNGELRMFPPMDRERKEELVAALKEGGERDWVRSAETDTLHLEWYLEKLQGFLISPNDPEPVVPEYNWLWAERVNHDFELSVEGVTSMIRRWEDVERRDRQQFENILLENPERAVVARGATTPTIEMFATRYWFSSLKIAERYLDTIRELYITFRTQEEADLALLVLNGEQPIRREMLEEWTEQGKLVPNRQGLRSCGGRARETVTFIGPHRIDSSGDNVGMWRQYQRLITLLKEKRNIRPRLKKGDA